MAMAAPDRRVAPRIIVNGTIAYRTSDSEEFRQGEIENISTGGARIWIADELPEDSRLLLRMVPEHEDETVLQFEAVVLHKLTETRDSMFGYGCRIEAA